ncbi:hypothetical protein [Stenotrophomonas sp.]|uniref:hypothetical protein n=1 Tax=Stenotrophomonas sp. TaxID=69392 RepID=UPI002FC67C2D
MLHAARILLITALLPLAACVRSPDPLPLAQTQTNEQGCTRQRSVGPQDAFADPAPVKQACVGPYLLALPQNIFDNQTGTEHDGSFSLALEYPSLQPFKPGARRNMSVDGSLRTLRIEYGYAARYTPLQILQRMTTLPEYEPDSPSRSLKDRIKGEDVAGLTPYYVDMARVRAHYLGKGASERTPFIQPASNDDWFISLDATGRVQRLIRCASREMKDPGYDWRGNVPVKNSTIGVARCEHLFVMPERKVLVTVSYLRDLLPQWPRMEARAKAVFLEADITPARGARRGRHASTNTGS